MWLLTVHRRYNATSQRVAKLVTQSELAVLFAAHLCWYLLAVGLWLRLTVSVGAAICIGFNIHTDLWRVAVHTVVWSSNCRSVSHTHTHTHTHTRARKKPSVYALFSHRTSHLRPYSTVILTKGFMFCKCCYPHKLNCITACIQRTPFKKETCMERNNSLLLVPRT